MESELWRVSREKGICYVGEKCWLMNESVRNNILIGGEEDE